MKFQSMSLLAGTRICNASCPFCISKMTGMREINQKPENINLRNLKKAISLALKSDVATVILTGKGEPTLYPEHIDSYLRYLNSYGDFPFIELQTNGSIIEKDEYRKTLTQRMLNDWREQGLTTVMISNCGYNDELNRSIYFPKRQKYIDMKKVVDKIHEAGLIVRYTTVGIKGGIDSLEELEILMEYTKSLGIEQVSWRPVAKTYASTNHSNEAWEWVDKNGLTPEKYNPIYEGVSQVSTKLYSLVHGATVYDYHGQNLCMTTCLTKDKDEEDKTLRQLIFFPNGNLYTDWQFKGSRLL